MCRLSKEPRVYVLGNRGLRSCLNLVSDLTCHEELSKFGVGNVAAAPVPDDLAKAQHDGAFGDLHRLARVLLDEEYGAAVGMQALQLVEHDRDRLRRQSNRGLADPHTLSGGQQP